MASPGKSGGGAPSLSSLQAALRKSPGSIAKMQSAKAPQPSAAGEAKRKRDDAADSPGMPPAKRMAATTKAGPGPGVPSQGKVVITKSVASATTQGKTSGLSVKAPGPGGPGGPGAPASGPPAKVSEAGSGAPERPSIAKVGGKAGVQGTIKKTPGPPGVPPKGASPQANGVLAPMPEDGLPAVSAIATLVQTLDRVSGGTKPRVVARLASSLGERLQIEHLNHFLRVLRKKLGDRAQRDGVRPPSLPAAATGQVAKQSATAAAGVAKAPAGAPPKAAGGVTKSAPSPGATRPPTPTAPAKQASVPAATKSGAAAKVVAKTEAPARPQRPVASPSPPASPEEDSGPNEQLFLLARELSEDPVCQDGMLRDGRLGEVFSRLWNGVAKKPKDWVVTWQSLQVPMERQTEALQKFLNMAFLRRGDNEQAPLIMAELVKNHKIKMRSVEEVLTAFGHNLDGILAVNEEAWHIYALFLVNVYPKPQGSGWGWSRVGWSWQSWWQFAEKCVQSLEPGIAFDVLAMVLQRIQDREGMPLANLPVWTEGEKLQRVLAKLGELGGCDPSEVIERLGVEGIVAEA
mmetsp:Transcript_12771/g.28208  ORF Transcript_12771/g.28208 Transcript_12771/m.28208 type:complete len:575 (+) Transcript_12771:119-1843(+)